MTGHREATALRVFALGQIDLEYGSDLWPDEWGEHIGPALALAGGIRFEEAWIGSMRDIITLCERSAAVHTT
jgi:hypothetical protein